MLPSAEMTRAGAQNQYPELTQFKSTVALDEADRQRTSCRKSAVYVHYCRQAAIEPYVISAVGATSCLEQAYSIKDKDDNRWTCVYVGEVSISRSGRCAATRFYYEFGGGGYLRQAPALELLCSLLYRLRRWTPYHTNHGRSLSLAPLLNVEGGTNTFKPTIQKLRAALRQSSLNQFHPKPLH